MSKRLTQEEFVRRVDETSNGAYEILSPYTKSHEKVLVKHKKCGYEWRVDPWNLMRGQIKECPLCTNKWKRTTDDFKKEVFRLYGEEYVVLGDYVGTNKSVLMLHKKCGNTFLMRPRDFKRGHLCQRCGKYHSNEATKTFQKRLSEKYGDKYELISEYKYARTKVTIKCNKCGTIWDTLPDNLMHGHGCPKCTISHGEDRICAWLEAHNIPYKNQYSDKRCRDKRALRFDFAVFDEIGNVVLLIEYDGNHHFNPTRFNSIMSNELCESNLEDVRRKDKIKSAFCRANNIKLLRIHHKQFEEIEQILESNLIRQSRAKPEKSGRCNDHPERE